MPLRGKVKISEHKENKKHEENKEPKENNEDNNIDEDNKNNENKEDKDTSNNIKGSESDTNAKMESNSDSGALADNIRNVTLILEPESRRVSVKKGSTIYDVLLALNYPIKAFCGGQGTCGKCLIRAVSSKSVLSPPTGKEIKKLGKDKIEKGFRLACQTEILDNSRIFLTDIIQQISGKILIDSDLKQLGIEKVTEFKPLVSSVRCNVKLPTIHEPSNDIRQLLRALKAKIDVPNGTGDFEDYDGNIPINDRMFELSRKAPGVIRQNKGDVLVYFRDFDKNGLKKGAEIFDIGAGSHADSIHGLAVDIGTTTIVGYLINLETGDLASIYALLNPQTVIGEDLVSRITYIQKYNGTDRAQELLVGAINKIIEETTAKAKISAESIKDIVILGNTGIHHMFFGLSTRYLATAPFSPVFKAPINISASKLGLICNPNVNVYSPPVIAGYVGTDTIGCIVASRIDQFEKFTLLVDIGTNGELVLGNKDGLITGSCAAGSALEGAHIRFGMRASEGAIETVRIDPETLEPEIHMIGDGYPVGICGSGLIDVIAEMIRAKIIKRSGKFNKKDPDIISNRRVIKKYDEYYYILFHPYWDKDKLPNNDSPGKSVSDGSADDGIITISQEDVRQLQLAKGAFLSGANILLSHLGKEFTDIEQVILAGAFGTYIDKRNAAFIGLIPSVPPDNIYQIGNAAGLGAQYCLKNSDLRDFANEIAYKLDYFEIASSPLFQKEYAYSLYFPHYDIERFPHLKDEFSGIPFR